jgi:hypothetical protein
MNSTNTMRDVAVLAAHYWAGHGMSYGSPDTCACGERTMPERGDEDVMVRRARAFAEHQAAMLAAAREAI